MKGRVEGTVYLVGFMRSGKSTVGALLARDLGREFVDLDERVALAAGRSIDRIWADEGEKGFRDRESAALAGVAGRRAVVATGGGLVERRANRELIRSTGICLWLRAPFEVIWGRQSVGPDPIRPLWRDPAAVRRLFVRRERLYAIADHAVDAGSAEAGPLARELAGWVRERELRR